MLVTNQNKFSVLRFSEENVASRLPFLVLFSIAMGLGLAGVAGQAQSTTSQAAPVQSTPAQPAPDATTPAPAAPTSAPTTAPPAATTPGVASAAQASPSGTGSLHGHISDPTGALIPGAQVS